LRLLVTGGQALEDDGGVFLPCAGSASLVCNLKGPAAAAVNNKGIYLSWWLYLRGGWCWGGRRGGRCVASFVSPFLSCFLVNSNVERSIRFCMYVDNTKFELTL
jgi:hypothetical protein